MGKNPTIEMKIDILCSDTEHPEVKHIKKRLVDEFKLLNIKFFTHEEDCTGGTFLFLIAYGKKLHCNLRSCYDYVLNLHASDLPEGKGWSPHVWAIINGATDITCTLLTVADQIDSGDIWIKRTCSIAKDLIASEINRIIFDMEFDMIVFAIFNYENIMPIPQKKLNDLKFYTKRDPNMSELNVNKTIAEQFNLLRICDPKRYPAFFILHDRKYILKLEAVD